MRSERKRLLNDEGKIGTLIYLFAVGLSLVNIGLALVLYIFIPALYILTPPFEHLLVRKAGHKGEDAEPI
jgi:multisubunit Na+/H+ antiporter MnhG subunit